MSASERAGLVGVAAVACAACCAAPIIGFVAALGIAGALAWATGGLVLAAVVLSVGAVAIRARRQRARCAPAPTRQSVELSAPRR